MNYILDESIVAKTGGRIAMIGHGIRGLWSVHNFRWLNEFFFKKNIQAPKQELYVCGLLQCYLINKLDSNILASGKGFQYLTYALLSDNENLIQSFTSLKFSDLDYYLKNGEATPLYALFALIKKEKSELERLIPIIYEKSIKRNKTYKYDAEVISALADKDQQRLEKGLIKMLSGNVSGRRNTGLQDFIYIHVSCYTKIAWRLGMEIELNHDRVPMDLMPIQPLKEYEIPYDFLKEVINENNTSNDD